jgi:hypothetical protein
MFKRKKYSNCKNVQKIKMFRIFKKEKELKKTENQKKTVKRKNHKRKNQMKKEKNPTAAVLTGRASFAPTRAERGSFPLTGGE